MCDISVFYIYLGCAEGEDNRFMYSDCFFSAINSLCLCETFNLSTCLHTETDLSTNLPTYLFTYLPTYLHTHTSTKTSTLVGKRKPLFFRETLLLLNTKTKTKKYYMFLFTFRRPRELSNSKCVFGLAAPVGGCGIDDFPLYFCRFHFVFFCFPIQFLFRV